MNTKNWINNILLRENGIFGIIRRSMINEEKDPFGKDIDEYFEKVEKMRDITCKNPIAHKLYYDAFTHIEE